MTVASFLVLVLGIREMAVLEKQTAWVSLGMVLGMIRIGLGLGLDWMAVGGVSGTHREEVGLCTTDQ
jgi:hypothetical protein